MITAEDIKRMVERGESYNVDFKVTVPQKVWLLICDMQQDYDSSASGYLVDSLESISRKFPDVTVFNTSDVNNVAKAKRYGCWWLLKGMNKQVANETAYIQRLRKELELLM